jgi:hypothetical protein
MESISRHHHLLYLFAHTGTLMCTLLCTPPPTPECFFPFAHGIYSLLPILATNRIITTSDYLYIVYPPLIVQVQGGGHYGGSCSQVARAATEAGHAAAGGLQLKLYRMSRRPQSKIFQAMLLTSTA